MFASLQGRFSKIHPINIVFKFLHKNRQFLDDKQIKKALGAGDKAKIDNLLAEDPSLIKNPKLLFYAIDGENLEMIKYVIEKGADVNQVSDGISPLIYVSSKIGKTDLSVIAAFLLENGADINYQDEQSGTTALIAALKFSKELSKMSERTRELMYYMNFSIMMVLTENPSLNKDITDKSGKSAYDYAEAMDYRDYYSHVYLGLVREPDS